MECWGASGGVGSASGGIFGPGAYVYGQIELNRGITPFVFVGQQGINTAYKSVWNGGGACGTESSDGSGGGATDIRTTESLTSTQLSSWDMTWNNSYGLNARILVAAGGGGTDDTSFTAEISCGGGLESEGMSSYEGTTTGATQTKGGHYDRASPYYTNVDGLFGEGGSSTTSNYFSAGGGGGYWGGVANDVCGQGGSSFISGHPGCIAIKSAESRDPSTAGSDNSVERATHYSGLYFTETVMIDGAGNQWTTSKGSKKLMPKPTGGADKYSTGEGHTGNGYARLFCIPFD